MNAKQKEQTIEEIKKLLEENNGIVKAEKLYPLGLTYKSIQGLVKAGILDHVKSGYYSMGYEEKPQEEIILGLFPDGILCMDSALYYYGILRSVLMNGVLPLARILRSQGSAWNIRW